jgi:hypothetical protein
VLCRGVDVAGLVVEVEVRLELAKERPFVEAAMEVSPAPVPDGIVDAPGPFATLTQ